MPVIVTRPAREAATWVQSLAALGVDAVPLPLIAIEPVADRQPLQDAWTRLAGWAALMFVSANAVEQFFAAAGPARSDAWRDGLHLPRCWAPGPGTVEALRAAGVPDAAIDAPAADAPQLDSEALWAQVGGQVQPGAAVLVVRGAGADGVSAGRDWLTTQLAAQGVRVETVAAYRRLLPRWDAAQLEQARRAAADASVWLFSSTEAVANLQQLLPAQDWTAGRALATHPRIVQAARAAGFGVVRESRAGLSAVAASLQSIA